MKIKTLYIFLISLLFLGFTTSTPSYKVAVLKYNGGGDWYANPTSLPNLVKFCNSELHTNIDEEVPSVEVGSSELYNYPFVHMTGHGNIVFSNQEAENIRNYLLSGGFLHIDDNYGMDEFIRPEMKKVFPNLEFIELPYSHPIFKQKFTFEKGLPKVHLHDDKPAQAFGLINEGKLICLYTYESDLGDGWEDQEVHNDSEEIRTRALQMGANILSYAFSGEID